MKQSIKYVLIFFACALLVLLLIGRRNFSDRTVYLDPGLVTLEEQYSDEEMDVHDAAFIKCLQDIESAHPGEKDLVVVTTCLCAAKRVLRAYINADDPAFKDDTYDASKADCYKITAKHMS
ncbi:MAG: hypothetical protein K2M34_01950 [Alphaproteobacteria bacterium]|nr:hypothetical protein [Alphaproteobacteria bacterium]